MSVTLTLLVTFFILLILNVPVAFSLACSSFVTILLCMDLPLTIIVQRLFVTFDSFPMMAIPLFMLAGALMNGSGITDRIIRLADLAVGHIRGGLAQTNILASVFFASISGSAAADTSVMGATLIPAMQKRGYDTDFSIAVTCTSSCLGPIIPPSLMMIIYASITGLSVGKLFIAGVIPGLFLAATLMITTYIIARKKNYPVSPKARFSEFLKALGGALDALLMPVIIIGGVMSGVFTATESGAIAVLYGIIVGLIRKQLTVKKLWDAIYEAALTTGSMMLIIGSAAIFSWILTIDQFPLRVVNLLTSFCDTKIMATVILLVLFLIVGMFIDGTSALMILVPILLPITVQYGFDPIHFAMFMVITLLIGGVTPPVGILLYIGCGIANVQVASTLKMLTPYILTMIAVALLVGLIPPLTTLLPNLIFP